MEQFTAWDKTMQTLFNLRLCLPKPADSSDDSSADVDMRKWHTAVATMWRIILDEFFLKMNKYVPLKVTRDEEVMMKNDYFNFETSIIDWCKWVNQCLFAVLTHYHWFVLWVFACERTYPRCFFNSEGFGVLVVRLTLWQVNAGIC